MKILWKGATHDVSGYSHANRAYIKALHEAGHEIMLHPRNHEQCSEELFSADIALMRSLEEKSRKALASADVVMHHYVPNEPDMGYCEGKPSVGYNTWETTKIPQHWVKNINESFALNMVPSHFNKSAYEDSGVTTPIVVVPHIIDFEWFSQGEPLALPEKMDGMYKFLSVFQWTPRKNPLGLLKAYFSTFYKRKDTVLILKTYRSNTSLSEQNAIRQAISQCARSMNFAPQDLPAVYVIYNQLTAEAMRGLYKACDCFVLAHRGEGFGLPLAEAIACGKPVITTAFGGQTDFCTRLDTLLIDYSLTPVCDMEWIPFYDGTQWWAEPNLAHLSSLLINIMKKPDKILKMGAKFSLEHLKSLCSAEVVVNKMVKAMEAIL